MAEKHQKKRLVLVVHGLGEQNAGETLDDLAGGLFGKKTDIRVSSDMRLMQEEEQPDKRKLRTFPCNIRRYCDTQNSDPKNPAIPHTTFAEVYWADLSQADHGSFRIFYGLIKTVLGLGHIVRAGAKQYFGENTFSEKMANLVPYLLHGPVAAVNVALAIGILFLYAASKVPGIFGEVGSVSAEALAILLASVFMIGLALYKGRSEVYYMRIFLGWLLILGILLGVLALLEWYGVDYSGFKMMVAEQLLGSGNNLCGKQWFGVALVFVFSLAWAATMVALFATAILTFKGYLSSEHIDGASEAKIRDLPPLALIIMCAMVWLWKLVVVTIWASVSKMEIFEKIFNEELLNIAIISLLPAFIGVVLVTVIVAIMLFSRFLWQRQFNTGATDTNEKFAADPVTRLLLSNGLIAGLIATGIILIGFTAAQYFDGSSSYLRELLKNGSISVEIILAAAVFIGGLAYSQSERIAQGLGVAKDLITYFKVEPKHVSGEDSGKRMGVFSRPGNYKFTEFRQRKRIHQRMGKVLDAMWKSDGFDELVIVSHSQGTVIATEFAKELRNIDSKFINLDDKNRESLNNVMQGAVLVTMGSPITHIYNAYLPSEFGPPTKQTDKFANWINIFRVDDFIGTYIGGPEIHNNPGEKPVLNLPGIWPKNIAVPPGGHTGYWLDEDVIDHLMDKVFYDHKPQQ